MTRNEYNDLHESLSYGHDAEILIDGIHYFVEWNDATIDVYKLNVNTGEKITSIAGSNKFETVNLLFAMLINGKSLNDHYPDIQVVDIE